MVQEARPAVATRPITDRINLVYLYVRDVERSIAFYRDVLGLPIVRDEHDPHWAEAKLPGGVRFALHAAGAGTQPQTPGTVRVDFEVANLDAAVERLRAAGVRVGEVEREPWGAVAEVVDPDGYTIDVFEPPKR